jgi:hypothetical protein
MIELTDLQRLLTLDRQLLLAELAIVCNDICAITQDISVIEQNEAQEKIDAYRNSDQTSVKGREWAASEASLTHKIKLIDERSDLAIRTEEKWFILRLLDGYPN